MTCLQIPTVQLLTHRRLADDPSQKLPRTTRDRMLVEHRTSPRRRPMNLRVQARTRRRLRATGGTDLESAQG